MLLGVQRETLAESVKREEFKEKHSQKVLKAASPDQSLPYLHG